MKVLDPEYMDTFCFQKWVFAQSRHISAVPEMGTSLQKANIGVPNTSASDAPEMWSILKKKIFWGARNGFILGSRNGPILGPEMGPSLLILNWGPIYGPKNGPISGPQNGPISGPPKCVFLSK